MTQFQFDTIIKIVQSGAPALADELCGSLSNLVNDYNKLYNDLDALKAKAEEPSEIMQNPDATENTTNKQTA